MQDIEISEITTADERTLEAVNKLISQLSHTACPMTTDSLARIVHSAASRLFAAIADGKTIGMCTLATYESPTGRKAWIEDVVVDTAFRGTGIGRKLVRHAIEEAHKQVPCTLMLTSKPARVAANKLYQSEGFEQKHTNVYKKSL